MIRRQSNDDFGYEPRIDASLSWTDIPSLSPRPAG